MFSNAMLSRRATVSTTRTLTQISQRRALLRPFSTTPVTMGKDSTMSKEPPQHQLYHFRGLASEVRSFKQFRKVLHTGLYSQLVAMEIPVGGDIGDEVHTVDQVLLFTSGEAKAIVAGKEQVSIANVGFTSKLMNGRTSKPLMLSSSPPALSINS